MSPDPHTLMFRPLLRLAQNRCTVISLYTEGCTICVLYIVNLFRSRANINCLDFI